MNQTRPSTPLWDAMVASVQGGVTRDGQDAVSADEDFYEKAMRLGTQLEQDRARLVEALKKQTAQAEALQQWAQECRQKGYSITAEALWSKLNGMVWNGAPLLRDLGES